MTLLRLCSRLCLCAALLTMLQQTCRAASRNTTQEVINNIHAPGTLGTPASNFTTDTNYTAIRHIIASTPTLKSKGIVTSLGFGLKPVNQSEQWIVHHYD